jgi:hypothetical protein
MAPEAVKTFLDEQKHFTPRRQGAKKTTQLFFTSLCALVRRLTDEIVYFFTASCAVGHRMTPLTRLRTMPNPLG